MKPPQYYQEVKDAVCKGIENLFDKLADNEKLTKEKIAEDLGISKTLLWKFETGQARVPEPTIKRMSGYFYKKEPQSAKEFEAILRRVLTDSRISSRNKTVVDRAASGGELRVRTSNNPPFSGSEDSFLDTITNRLFSLASLNKREEDAEMPKHISDVRDAIWLNETDLAVGYVATIDRALVIDFIPMPLRVCLAGVIGERDKNERNLVEEVLTRKRGVSSRLRPIVVKNDIGFIHVLKTLEYQPDEVDVLENANVRDIVAAFRSALNRGDAAGERKIPVIVVNEFVAFRILDEMEFTAIPVLPLSSREAACARSEVPAYFLSLLGCGRRPAELRKTITQLLLLFLGTEIEFTSRSLEALSFKLMGQVERASRHYEEYGNKEDPAGKARRFIAAYNWTLYNLCLDQYSLENSINSGLPWKVIWKRGREHVLANLWNRWGQEITAQINLMSGPEELPTTEKKFHKLCESLDLPIQLTRQNEYVLEDRDILVRTIQNALQGAPIGPPIEYDESGKKKPGGEIELVVNPRDAEKTRVLDGFLAELESVYAGLRFKSHRPDKHEPAPLPDAAHSSAQEADTPLRRIQDFREKDLGKTFGDRRDETFILVSVGADIRHYLGSACLRPYPYRLDDSICMELFYLWTQPEVRRLAIAESIIREAKRYAKEHNYTHLVVEVIRTLNEAVTYFLKNGFVPVPGLKRSEHIVMHCPL